MVVFREKHPETRVLPMENTTCASFEEYEEIPEKVTLAFMEFGVAWVSPKLSGAIDALGVDTIEIKNWLICFGCTSEELRVVVPKMAY